VKESKSFRGDRGGGGVAEAFEDGDRNKEERKMEFIYRILPLEVTTYCIET